MSTSTSSTPSETAAGDDLLVRKDIFVRATPQRAFDVFTREMTSWWPLASHHVGKADAKAVVIEPHVGGAVMEVGVDESTCTWGHVLEWDPPGRFAFTWELDSSFKVDPRMSTRVEVTFTADNGGTRVDLVHRGLRSFGEKAEEMAAIFDSPGGWTGILQGYAARVSAA